MKKTVRVLSIVIMVAMIIAVLATQVLAVTLPTPEDPTGTQINQMGGRIIGLIRAIGAVVAVAILVVLGVKYMAASPEGKADYKSSMIPYIVGAILVFAGSQIAAAIVEMINGWA